MTLLPPAGPLTLLDQCAFEKASICGMIQATTDDADWVHTESSVGAEDHTLLGRCRGQSWIMSVKSQPLIIVSFTAWLKSTQTWMLLKKGSLFFVSLSRCWVLHALQYQGWAASGVRAAGVPDPLPQKEDAVSAVLLQDDWQHQRQAGDLGQDGWRHGHHSQNGENTYLLW